MFDKIIKGGAIVTASDTIQADIGIQGEKIAVIGSDLPEQGAEVIHANNRYVFPGCIDVHTHMDDHTGGFQISDDFLTGTTGAAWGGTTTIVDFATQQPEGRLQGGMEMWHRKAEGKAVIDYAFHMIIIDLPESNIKDMDFVVDEGLTSFKMFMAYPGMFMADDETIFRAMLRARENGAMICMHAENGAIIDVLVKRALAEGKIDPKYHSLTRPMSLEAEATHRAIILAEIADVPIYIVHLSAADALRAVREARERGLPVYAETCPQYLFLDDSEYERPNFEAAKYVVSPPLRPKGNEESLWKGLVSNDLQVVASDHSPYLFHGPSGKQQGRRDFSQIPNGGPGVETRLQLLYDGGVADGRITLNRMVEVLSTSPAKLFGLYPQKGTIGIGSDADLVIFDPNKKHRINQKAHHMRIDYNMYEGREVTGAVETVLLRGSTLLKKGEFLGRPGQGRFIKRQPQQPRNI